MTAATAAKTRRRTGGLRPRRSSGATVAPVALTLALLGGHRGALAFCPAPGGAYRVRPARTSPIALLPRLHPVEVVGAAGRGDLAPLMAVGNDDDGTSDGTHDVVGGGTKNNDKKKDDDAVTKMKTVVETDDDNSNRYNPLFPPASHYVIEDVQLLFFDVILLLNLTMSISFWVVHRLQFSYLGGALSEGSLLAILWVGSGLYHGSFLYSAAEGGNNSVREEKTGPGAAGVLAVNTMVTAASLRLVVALGQAIWEHRYALVDGGAGGGESLIPMELGAGFVLMGMWRALHSQYVRRW